MGFSHRKVGVMYAFLLAVLSCGQVFEADVRYPDFVLRVPIVNGVAPRLLPRTDRNGCRYYEYDYENGLPYDRCDRQAALKTIRLRESTASGPQSKDEVIRQLRKELADIRRELEALGKGKGTLRPSEVGEPVKPVTPTYKDEDK